MGIEASGLNRLSAELRAEPQRLKKAIESIKIDGSKPMAQQAADLQREMKRKAGITMSRSEALAWLKDK